MSNDRNPSPAGIGSMAIGLGRAATIVVADDEWMFMACLRQLLTAPPPTIKDVYGIDVGAGFTVVGEAGSGEDTPRQGNLRQVVTRPPPQQPSRLDPA